MEHIFQQIPGGMRWQVLTPLLLMWAVINAGILMKRFPLAPPETLGLEIARTPARAETILREWEKKRLTRPALIGVGIDYLDLILYSNILACCCAWYAEMFTGIFALCGVTLAFLQWVAAACDMVENFYLFQMLLSGDGRGAATCTCVSLVKWLLALAGLAYIVVAMTRRSCILWHQHAGWATATVAGAVTIAAVAIAIVAQLQRAWTANATPSAVEE